MSASTNPEEKPLDLDLLQSLNIGPDWATSSTPHATVAPRNFDEKREPYGHGRDRRPSRDRRDFASEGRGDRPERRGRDFPPRREGGGDRCEPRRQHGEGFPPRHGEGFPLHTGNFPQHAPRSRPMVEITFFPEEKPFSVLIKAIKASLRTYELFEIAHLFLDKEDRFLVGCRPFDAEKNPSAQLYQSVPDQLPFLSESDAVFTRESISVDPPKGIFQMVSKCGFTGEILGAPNYHGYQQRLREHHAARLAYLPFEKFTSRIESVRDKEQIDAWLKSMTQVTRYTLKNPREGEPAQYDSLESARAFLLSTRKDRVVRTVQQVRFPGKSLETLPAGPLRSAIESELRYQRNFPLVTANFLRGRLRKIGFVFHKRGSHDVTYVSAVERKFRTPQTIFADSIQRVFDFIEKTPNVKVSELPEKFLGISPSETKLTPAKGALRSKPEMPKPKLQAAPDGAAVEFATSPAEAPVETLTGVPNEIPVATPIENSGTASSPEAPASPMPEVLAPAENAEPVVSGEFTESKIPASEVSVEVSVPSASEAAPADASVVPVANIPAPGLEMQAEPATQPALDLLASNAIRDLLNTIRWLVSEGYVTEYSDGRLYAHPVLTEAQSKSRTTVSQDPKKRSKKQNGSNATASFVASEGMDSVASDAQGEEISEEQPEPDATSLES